jgi:hypothetical protein
MSHGIEFNWLIDATFVVRTAACEVLRLQLGYAKKFKTMPTNVIETNSRNFLEYMLKGCDLPGFADFRRDESRAGSMMFPDPKIGRLQIQQK